MTPKNVPNPKSNSKADDYLRAFAEESTEQWFSMLVSEILKIRRTPSKSFLDKIYSEFLVTHKLKKKPSSEQIEESSPGNHGSSKSTQQVNIDFTLERLCHESGVNALKNGTALSIHPKLTVVYGKNGSGKSGFVRILKRLGNSRTQEDVWQNVHTTKSRNKCKGAIIFTEAGARRTYQWSGESNIAPFRRMSIFDGKCIPINLTKSLNFSYQPYGFELFQALSSSLVDLQERLSRDIQNAEAQKPDITDLFDESTAVGKSIASIASSTKREDVDKLPKWSQRMEHILAGKEKKRKDLQNPDQQSEILRTRLKAIKALQGKMEEIQSEFSSEKISAYLTLIKLYNQSKAKLERRKDITLEDFDIPEMDSDEWQNFVQAGEEYISLALEEGYPREGDRCIYCQQRLSKTAMKLIGLIRALFEEEETSDLEEVEEELNGKLEQLKRTSFSDGFSFDKTDFVRILPKSTVDSSFSLMREADLRIEKITNLMEKKKITALKPLSPQRLIASAKKARNKIESEISALTEAKRKLAGQKKRIDAEIADLEDIRKLTKSRGQIERCVELNAWVARASRLLTSDLNTRPVTDLSKRAWKEMVSESFKQRFIEECRNLDAPEIELAFHGEHGSQMREKSIEGLSQIDQFLSEGEQKAVALADFFAELSVQDKKIPVILDDPATSFDHERKERIAKRIAKESESNQVVVFTHDLMFAHYIHEQVMNANGDLDPDKAVFHNVERTGRVTGYVSENDYPGSRRFASYVQKVDEKLAHIEGLTGKAKRDEISGAYSMLRRAVEKAVEEKIFGKVIIRWSDQIQMHNVSRATLSKKKLESAKELHEKFSRFIEAHNQSDEMLQNAMPDIQDLRADVVNVKDLVMP